MLILLIGPKGSGKSHIGRILETTLGVHFFHVESHWMKYHAACARAGRTVSIGEGIQRIRPAVVNALSSYEHVCIETTGASMEILDDLLKLGDRFGLLLVQVKAPLSLCLERVATRDQTNQIPMNVDRIRKVYDMSVSVDLPFDVVLQNSTLTQEEILSPFRKFGIGAR